MLLKVTDTKFLTLSTNWLVRHLDTPSVRMRISLYFLAECLCLTV